jgi:sugar lactone lactonase YvrE
MTGRRRIGLGFLLVLLALFGYLLFWPVDVDPEDWSPPKAPELTGPYAKNDALKGVTWIARELHGPEAVAVGADGTIYTGTMDGKVVRLAPDGTNVEILATTGGRPLGVKLDAQGRLVVADADKGLLRLENGAIQVLATEQGGVPFKFVDDLSIASDGTIYFTDASSRWSLKEFKMDVVEHRPSGRLLAYRPDGKVELVADKLYFANGVALAPDESYALVTETSSYRVLKIWLRGDKAGTREVFVDNLPGFVDNITWSPSRRAFWLAIDAPRDGTLDWLASRPFLRKAVVRLPDALQPQPKRHAFAIAFDESGKVVANLQHAGGDSYAPVASVIEVDGALWLGSYLRDGLAKIAPPPLPAVP